MSEGTILGRKLKAARDHKRMTLEAVSKASGISIGAISDIENGKRRTPRKDTILALSRAVGVDPLVLLDDQIESIWTAFEVNGVEVPEDVRDWLMKQESASWIKLAEQCTAADITPDEAMDILQTIIKVKEKRQK